MADLSDKLEIAPAVVVEVIYLHHEGETRADELRAFIAALNADEKAHLTALAWVGRGAFEAEDYDAAVTMAHGQASVPTEDYLLGMLHLSENLEDGLEAMGVDVSAEEEDFL